MKEIEIKLWRLHFAQPFKIGYERVTTAPVVIIRLIDEQGRIGLGSGYADKEVSRETIGQISKIIKEKIKLNFFDQPLDKLDYYHKKIQKTFQGLPVAQQAVEEAYLNLYCHSQKIDLRYLFSTHPRQKASLGITLSIQSLAKTLSEAEKRHKEGYRLFKLKGGLNLKNDLLKLEKLRTQWPKINLSLDVNQGYDFKEAVLAAKFGAKIGLNFLEQPIKKDQLIQLKKLAGLKLISIIADEAASSYAKIEKILKGDFADGVNIKLMKCGGPLNFVQLYQLARKLKKQVMIGCMYESNISITTGLALALSLDLDYVELDSGHFDFKDDPVIGGAVFRNGQIGWGGPLRLKS